VSRALTALALSLALAAPSLAAAEQRLRGVRVWPAKDYTRVTLESDAALRYSSITLKDPDRLVLDLEEVDFLSLTDQTANKVSADDPQITALRTGRFKPGTVRLVIDLKTEVRPQIFTLPPIGDYGHRLVLDLYPVAPPDLVMALLQKKEAAESDAAQPPPAPAAPPRAGEARKPPAVDERAKPTASRPLTIAVDAGHGGEDPGARGRRGTDEKQVTLAIARKLKTLIDAEPNLRAVLVRDGDYFIPLAMRVEKARRVKADLFVSVHADAYLLPHARGSSVFALSERGATSAAASWLAKRENDADLIGGVNLGVKDRYLAQTLLDLSQTATINDSLRLARSVLIELGEINALHKPQVEQAGFAVLKAPDIPSILVETAFISNPDEEKRLADQRYQEKVARAILAGIKRYFAAYPATRPTLAAIDADAGSALPAARPSARRSAD